MKSKHKNEIFEKVKVNQENVHKHKQFWIEQIQKRSLKKEKYAENFKKTEKAINKQQKDKRDERRSLALKRVKEDMFERQRNGMTYYHNILKEINDREV